VAAFFGAQHTHRCYRTACAAFYEEYGRGLGCARKRWRVL
jgi:hypothetical protein